VLELIATTLTVFQMLVGSRLGEALLYYFAEADSESAKRNAVTNALAGGAALALLSGVTGLLASRPLSLLIFGAADYDRFFLIAFLGVGLDCPVNVGFAYLRALDQPRSYTAISLLRLLVSAVSAIVFLVYFKWGIAAMLWAHVVAAAVTLARLCQTMAPRLTPRIDVRLLVTQLRFSLPISLAGLGLLFVHYGDRYFLQRSVSLADIGTYAVAYKIGLMVSFVVAPFNIHWQAQMYNVVRMPDGWAIYERLLTYLLVVLVAAALALSVFAGPILTLLAAPSYAPAARYVGWIALAYVLRSAAEQIKSVFNVYGKTGYHLQVALPTVALCAVCYVVLIPPFGVPGAVASTVLAFLGYLVFTFWSAQRVRRCHFEYGRIAHLCAAAAFPAVLSTIWRPDHQAAQAAVGTLAMGLWLLTLLGTGFFRRHELDTIRSWAGRFASGNGSLRLE
jgi:O-antigen/teichoic acid export membrane protein